MSDLTYKDNLTEDELSNDPSIFKYRWKEYGFDFKKGEFFNRYTYEKDMAHEMSKEEKSS